MTTVTTPTKKIVKNKELVVIPRHLYNEFLEWQEKIKSARTFKPTKTILRDLEKAREEYRRGKTMTLHELKQKLEIRN